MGRYETPEDNRETHRAGEAYRNFRAAVAAEGLLDGYPDLRFWRPTGIGFLARSPVNFMTKQDGLKDYVVIQDLTPLEGAKSKVLEALRAVAESAENTSGVGSFWVLEREDKDDGDDVVVFTRFASKGDYEAFVATEKAEAWKSVDGLCQHAQTTTWAESGIGYLNR